ncbi:hypothetical protein [Aeromonas sp. 1HA1]|uniref:hypothetical protein n=1 Tax=Aeromonas sp. 1HA1 TaxID=2699193 RepID=UPI0023DDCE9D|nr:hypothetical protein [Aeromonas sp. 1HA1]MDF2415454.1 hypothetical protein [Aeromonas sp. 1HA1]
MTYSQSSQLIILALFLVKAAVTMLINIVTPSITARGISAVLIYYFGAANVWQIECLAKALIEYSDH